MDVSSDSSKLIELIFHAYESAVKCNLFQNLNLFTRNIKGLEEVYLIIQYGNRYLKTVKNDIYYPRKSGKKTGYNVTVGTASIENETSSRKIEFTR